MTGKRIRRVSLYVTIFFLALAVLNLYKSKDNTITGTDDLKQYDMSAEGMGEDSGVKLIDSKDYVFEKEYNIAPEEKAVVKSEEKDVKEEKVAEKKKPEAPKSRKYVVKRGDSINKLSGMLRNFSRNTIVPINNGVLFNAYVSSTEFGLWYSNGTSTGTINLNKDGFADNFIYHPKYKVALFTQNSAFIIPLS